MTDKLDSFVKELQDKIYDDALKDYGRKAFDRWLDPKYMYAMDNADTRGRVTGSCAIRWRSSCDSREEGSGKPRS
jgi:hypothetical protein